MSVVTGVTLICSVSDGHEEDEHGNDVPTAVINSLNDWLDGRNCGPLISIEGLAGGNKHPQCCIYAAGFDHFPEDDFAEQFLAAAWDYPDNVILVMNPEEGATKVYAPPAIGSGTHGRTWCEYVEDVCPVCDTHQVTPSTT